MRIRRGVVVLAGLAGLIASPPVLATAQAPGAEYAGRPVAMVRLLSEGVELREPRLLDLIETKPGAPLSMAAVRESILHLMALRRFQNVQVDADAQPSGIVLTYNLSPVHSVRQVLFRGALGLSEGDLRSAVIDRFGTTPRVGQAPDIALLLQQLYKDRGYMKARVTPQEVVDHRSETTDLILNIEAGPRTRVASVDLQALPASELPVARERINLEPGEPYDPTLLQRRIRSYTESLRSRGFYEATVVHRPRFTPDEEHVTLSMTVDRGPLVRIEFTGDPLPQREQADLVPIQREASVDEDLLEDSQRRIESYLRGQGYRDATASFSRVPGDGELTMTIRFVVKRGVLYRVADIAVEGHRGLSAAELQPALIVEGGQPFVQARLEREKAAIAELYRRRGFEKVEVKETTETAPPREAAPGVTWLNVRVTIAEGVQTRIGSIGFAGNAAVPESELRPALGSIEGAPLYRAQLAADRDALLLVYLNRGYPEATVTADLKPSDGGSRAAVAFSIHEGPQIIVDHILIAGNQRTSVDTIERELQVTRGQPLGFNDEVESRRRLLALGLFRSVTMTVLQHGSEANRDILIAVEEAPATSVGLGGGFEFQTAERIEAAPRGFFEIGRRNLWGKNRSIDLFTRVSVRLRSQLPDVTDAGVTRAREYRVVGTYREPKLFGSSADGLAAVFVEQASRPSFSFTRRGSNAEVARRFTPTLSMSTRYSFERTELFNKRINPKDELPIDRVFPQVRLSGFASSLVRDTRDDQLDPGSGELMLIDGEIDARALASEVGFAKTLVQGFLYRRLPATRRLIFAGGARLGLAAGFPGEVDRARDQTASPDVCGTSSDPTKIVVCEIPASKRFFAGGDTTVRGFSLDQLGRPNTLDQDGTPKGGGAFAVFNAELRALVWRDLVQAVGFVDVGNVFARASELNPADLRGAVGFGVRYRSPFGPIRFDMGFKLNIEEFVSGKPEDRYAIHVSIGQAF